MRDSTLTELVDKAIAVDRAIKLKQKDLNDLKGQLINEASERKAEHQPTDNGGVSWVATGSDGCIARVTFPCDKLVSVVNPTTKTGKKLIERLGKFAKELLEPVEFFRPVKGFRDLVRDKWPSRDAERHIAAFEGDSTPTVSFATAETPKREEDDAS